MTAIIFLSLHSCVVCYVKKSIEIKSNRKQNSILRFNNHNEVLLDNTIRTDGIYVDEYLIKYPKWNPLGGNQSHCSMIAGKKFFKDGTVFNIILYGNDMEIIKDSLDVSSIHTISIMDMGLFSINPKDSTIYHESYWRQSDYPIVRYLFPYQLEIDSLKIMDNNTLYKYNHLHLLSGLYRFISCPLPISSYHPFKSKKWLWNDKEAKEKYIREWRRIKKKRKTSRIKYTYGDI